MTTTLRWAAAAVTAGLVAGGAALGLHVGNLHNGLIAASFTVVGLYVLYQRPDNREARLFLATGGVHAVMFFGRQYALDDRARPGQEWLGWLGVWPLPLALVLAGVTLMCFPTGHLPSAGWRPVVVAMTGLGAVLSLMSALWPVEYARTALLAAHPLNLAGAATADAVYDVLRPPAYLLIQLVAAVAVVQRLRRADGDERRQLRWFVLAVASAATIMVVGLLIWRSPLPGVLTVPLVAVVAGAAILKHPHRMVHGHRVTPYEALARIPRNANGLLDGMCEALADGLGAQRVVLWTGGPEELRPASSWPATDLPEHARTLAELDGVPVLHDGRMLGAITVTKREKLTGTEHLLLADLAAQAGLILELRASAARIVTAGDTARRRLERDLHDGVQQRLVTLALELGSLIQRIEDDEELGSRARRAREQLLEATSELRELARGLHPAVLTQDGLEPALRTLADRSAVPVRLDLSLTRRPPADVEATVYFVVGEALTNATKHAAAQRVDVTVALVGDGLSVRVEDDGCGGAAVLPGGGLEGLSDRLATLGARLVVTSDPNGTRLATVIPCG